LVCGTISEAGTEGNNMLLVKYDSDGFEYWRYSHDYIDNQDAAVALCIDSNDDIYLTGGSYSPTEYSDMLTIKVDITGALDWEEVYDFNHLYDLGVKIALSGTRVIVTGVGQLNLTSAKILALSYMQSNGTLSGVSASSTGLEQSIEEVSDLYVDENDNIYIAGSVVNPGYGYDFKLIKLDEDLEEVWVKTWDGEGLNDYARGVKVAPNGDVYLCGTSATSGDGDDMVLIKYNSSGTQQWVETYNGNYRGDDRAETLEYHSDGFIYVAGSSFVVSNMDYLALKYNTSGDLLWEINYNSPYNKNDRATNMAIDSEGDIIVTGQCERDGVLKTYFAVKYVERTVISPQSSEIIPSNAHFTPNVGQVRDTEGDLADDVVFVSRNDYPAIFVQNDKLTYVLSALDTTSIDSLRQDTLHRVDMIFNKSNNNQRFYPLGEKPYLENYYLGHMQQFAERVHPYEQLVSFEVYDDIDVIVSNNSAGLKYYFVCKPGFNLGKLDWSYDGADTVLINNDALEIHTSLGAIIHPQAEAWQIDGNGDVVSLAWQPDYVNSNGNISFSLGSFNSNYPLIIAIRKNATNNTASSLEPEWSTYLRDLSFGHSSASKDITINTLGEIFICGKTGGINFPGVEGSDVFQSVTGGNQDAFVSKFDYGYALQWSTYAGGSSNDFSDGIASTNDEIYFAGITEGYHPNVFTEALQSNPSSFVDDFLGSSLLNESKGFIVRLDAESGEREWATYFGHPRNIRIECDASNNLFVVGSMVEMLTHFDCVPQAGSFPMCGPLGSFSQSQHLGFFDGFISKFNHNCSLTWSTLIGGTSGDVLTNLKIDNQNQTLYVVGHTSSGSQDSPICNGYWDVCAFCPPIPIGFPICDAGGFYQSDASNFSMGVLMAFSLTGIMEWSTFFGGTDCHTSLYDVEVSSEGDVYIGGVTNCDEYSADFCETPSDGDFPFCAPSGSYTQSYGGGLNDAFIARFRPDRTLLWSTYYGGELEEEAWSWDNDYHDRGALLSVDYMNNVYLYGTSQSGSNLSTALSMVSNTIYYNQSTHGGSLTSSGINQFQDNYVCKFSPNNEMLWSSYFGGHGGDNPGSIATYQSKVFITGSTSFSQSFPLYCPEEVISGSVPYCDLESSSPNPNVSTMAYLSQLSVGEIPTNILVNESIFENELEFNVFPNPISDHLIIHFNKLPSTSDGVEIFVYSNIGQEIYVETKQLINTDDIINLDFKNNARGLYFVVARMGNYQYSKKIIKQ
jgi:hypothetical protein